MSSTEGSAESSTTLLTGEASASDCTPTSIPLVPRHGSGDRLIKLNVGGKEFQTLRSTLQASPVLAEYCARAEANGELEAGGAVFVDRDPTHFAIILSFLRNKTEGVAYNSQRSRFTDHVVENCGGGELNGDASLYSVATNSMKLATHPKYVRLPKIDDKNYGLLEDLYIEAQHFQLRELERQLCKSSIWVTIMSFFNGGRNPFQTFTEFLQTARRSALALVGGGSIYGAFQAELAWLENLLPPNMRPKKLEPAVST